MIVDRHLWEFRWLFFTNRKCSVICRLQGVCHSAVVSSRPSQVTSAHGIPGTRPLFYIGSSRVPHIQEAVTTLKWQPNGRHFTDGIFICIFGGKINVFRFNFPWNPVKYLVFGREQTYWGRNKTAVILQTTFQALLFECKLVNFDWHLRKSLINNSPALVPIMARRPTFDERLFEPMLTKMPGALCRQLAIMHLWRIYK